MHYFFSIIWWKLLLLPLNAILSTPLIWMSVFILAKLNAKQRPLSSQWLFRNRVMCRKVKYHRLYTHNVIKWLGIKLLLVQQLKTWKQLIWVSLFQILTIVNKSVLKLCQVWISSTLYARVFRTNVVLTAFSSYMYVTCTWKKLFKRHLYKKFVRKNVDEIDTWTVRFDGCNSIIFTSKSKFKVDITGNFFETFSIWMALFLFFDLSMFYNFLKQLGFLWMPWIASFIDHRRIRVNFPTKFTLPTFQAV